MGRHREIFAERNTVKLFGPDSIGEMVHENDYVSIFAGQGVGSEGWVRSKDHLNIYIELRTGNMVKNQLCNVTLKEKAAQVMFG